MLFRLLPRLGYDIDETLNALGRGFTGPNLLPQLRQRACVPILRLLARRWRTFDVRRLQRRHDLGARLDVQLGRRRRAPSSY
ncbi:MAG: hypothetical protein KDA58_08125 [Planctomycetaceae bacterium]|nr:hypothetical protein [Planctomycetaceae bacterium]